MKERENIQDKSRILHAIREVAHDLWKNKATVFSIFLPIFYLLFFLRIDSNIFGEVQYDIDAIIDEKSEKW